MNLPRYNHYLKLAIIVTLIFIVGSQFSCEERKPIRNRININKDTFSEEPSIEKLYTPEIGKYGGQLVLSTISDPKSFNPIITKETSTTAVTNLIFEGLVRMNGITIEPEPNLASGWQIKEDGKKWIFYLRKDVKWSDGKKFTAKDVLFTFNELIYNSDIPTSSRDIFTIEGKKFKIKKIDDYTVEFELPSKFAPFLQSMTQEILPEHILKDKVEKGEFNYSWGLDESPSQIVGTGPFMLEEYIPGQRVTLVRNPNYWRKDKLGNKLPYLEKIIFLIVQNQETSLLNFKQKITDFYSLRGTDYPILKPLEDKLNFTIYNTGAAFGTNFIVFNQNNRKNPNTGKPYVTPYKLNWFRNLNFRKAIAYAIDKEAIINIVLNGFGYPQYSSMSPSAGFYFTEDVEKYEYNLDKARQILKDEGFLDRDGDGYLEDAQGNTVEFSLYTNSGNTQRLEIAKIIRKDLEKLRLKVHFLQLEFNNLVTKLDSSYDWDAILIGLTGGVEPHFGSNVWLSSGHLHMWNPRQDEPSTEWEERIDEIFIQGVQEMDKYKRKTLYDEWQLIVSQYLPVIYTVLPANIFAVRNKFGNLYPTSFGGAFHNIEEIYVKSEDIEQKTESRK